MIVDFRARPHIPEYAHYLGPRIDAIERDTGLTAVGFPKFRAKPESVEEFVANMDEARIDVAVFAARNRASSGPWPLSAETVAAAVAQFPDRLVGLAGVDLARPESIADDILHAVQELGLRGVCVDPFQVQAAADDPQLEIVYETCENLGVPVVVTMGAMPGVNASLACANPLALDNVALRHPGLVIVGSHSGWPFTSEMIAVAYRHPNVYFENSFYHFAPGAQVLVEAANTLIGAKMLYASAYPFAPLRESLEAFEKLPFSPAVKELVLGGNAARLLDLNAPNKR
jgi:predicted TIM-barrel fold metal-dependent hydrolase